MEEKTLNTLQSKYEDLFASLSLAECQQGLRHLLRDYQSVKYPVIPEVMALIDELTLMDQDIFFDLFNSEIATNDYTPLECARAYLLALYPLWLIYREQGIDLAVFQATISDYFLRTRLYRTTHDQVGLTPRDTAWLRRIFILRIFKLGSFQFETLQLDLSCDFQAFQLSHEHRARLDHQSVLSLHIMQDEDISLSSLDTSLRLADGFFDDRYVGYLLVSWLLYSGHQHLLPTSARIRRLRSAFEILSEDDDMSWALDRVFNLTCLTGLEDFVPHTRLQVSAQRQPQDLGIAMGWIDRPVG